MTITLSSLCAHGADAVKVGFEIGDGVHVQNESHVISGADCADLRLCKGVCTPEQYDAVAHAAALYGAKRKGLSLLAYGRHSEHSLVRKLCARGIERTVAAEAAAILAADGYLNGEADALAEAERAVAKLWGKRRIAASLREKGYDDESIRAALLSLEESGVDFEENCTVLLRKRFSSLPEDARERQKITASLMRMGYGTEEIRAAFRTLSRS